MDSVSPVVARRSLPRIGLHFGVPKACEQVHWYGAGPHECYPDRKSGAPVREYSSTVQEMHVPYIVPGTAACASCT